LQLPPVTDKLSLSVLHVKASALQSCSFRGQFALAVFGRLCFVAYLECDRSAVKIHNAGAAQPLLLRDLIHQPLTKDIGV
jgi:hypothetical protein